MATFQNINVLCRLLPALDPKLAPLRAASLRLPSAVPPIGSLVPSNPSSATSAPSYTLLTDEDTEDDDCEHDLEFVDYPLNSAVTLLPNPVLAVPLHPVPLPPSGPKKRSRLCAIQ
jgi:hypothetical protein